MNAVLPGFIETPMTETVPEHLISVTKMLIPAARLGKPEGITIVYQSCMNLSLFFQVLK